MYRALVVFCLAVGLLVACNSTVPPQELSAEEKHLGKTSQPLLSPGEACNADVQCDPTAASAAAGHPLYGFCVDTVCCMTACGAGARDALVCSNVYDPARVGPIVGGTCITVPVDGPCGELEGLNPCTWRGSDVNGGGNCPAPGSGTPARACYVCDSNSPTPNSTCPPGLPICIGNGCTTCTGDYNGTTNGTTCPDIDFPICTGGGCVQCTATNPGRCPALNKACSTATNSCTGCDGDNGPPTTTFECQAVLPVCANPGVDGTCIECSAGKVQRCTAQGLVCDTTANPNKCVECLTFNDCTMASDPVCTNKDCVPCTGNNSNSPPTASPCPTAGKPACNLPGGTCVQCNAGDNTACAAMATDKVCINDGTNVCVQCNDGADCNAVPGKPFCGSNHLCTGMCMNDGQCPAGAPKCNGSGLCVECLGDAQCGGAKPPFCVGEKCVACRDFNDCGGTTPVCSSAGMCVPCNGGNGSNAPNKCPTLVNPACKGNGACVECTGGDDGLCMGSTNVCNTTTDKCAECTMLDQSACGGAKPVCDFGLNNGTCVACNGDNGSIASDKCPTPQLPACVPGNCFQCSATNLTACLALNDPTKTVCDVLSHMCVQCNSNVECQGNVLGICDLGSHLCAAGCSDDTNCVATPLTPKCKTSAVPPRCVECLDDTGCAGKPGTPSCDTATNKCVACLSDAACGGNTPICLAGTCVECNGNRGDGANAACKTVPQPACIMNGTDDGKCAECSDTDLRLCVGAKPACHPTTHLCVQCGSNAQCSGTTPICNAAGTCVACNGDQGSNQSAACYNNDLPACITAAGVKQGSCLECTATNKTACDGQTPVCDTVANECVQCVTNPDCTGPNGVCNTQNHMCTLGCTSDANCTQALPACKLPNMFCVECTATNKTKCVGDKPNCDVALNVCVGCTMGSECPGDKPVCDPITKMCTATCTLSSQCPGDMPVCDPVSKTCVDCVTNADCKPPTPICNTTTHMCGTDCSKSSECPGDAPICNPMTKKCVDCVTNNDCPPANPICNTTTGMCGTECTKNSECPNTAPICNPQTKNCVECIDDSMCSDTRPRCDGQTNKCVDDTSIEGGGCACSTVQDGRATTAPMLLGLGLVVTALARRRKSQHASH